MAERSWDELSGAMQAWLSAAMRQRWGWFGPDCGPTWDAASRELRAELLATELLSRQSNA